MTVMEELSSLPDRIRDAAGRCADLDAQLRNERERRDELIVTAVDEGGMSIAQAARTAGLSKPQVIRILSRSSED